MPALILRRDVWPTVGRLVHTIATRGGFNGNISNWPPSIPQCHPSTRRTFKYGLEGRLLALVHMRNYTHMHTAQYSNRVAMGVLPKLFKNAIRIKVQRIDQLVINSFVFEANQLI